MSFLKIHTLLFLSFCITVLCRPGQPLADRSPTTLIDDLPTCEAVPLALETAEDLRSKTRAEPGVCPNHAYHLLKRQTADATDDYSCGPSKPCSNNACCAKSGYCGYGPESCGDGTTPNDKCWSNCDAHAECGRYAEEPGTKCPLNVCCSQYGFCGMESDFCKKTDNKNTTCQSNCDQPGSGSSGGDVQSRIIGYYEAWQYKKSCMGMGLKDIPVSSITHLHYSFAYITPDDYEITTMDDTVPSYLFSGITDLKKQNPDLKVIVSIGGWTFNDNGTSTQPVFGEIAGSSGNRDKFIKNLLDFMQNYGFDGVDFDWEYPGAPDRGGHKDDGENYTKLMADLRDQYSGIISFTAPTSYWYLRHFDLKGITKHVDWINVMSYDLHGEWDKHDPIGSHVLAHTNLTEIKTALDLYWRNSVPAEKINLGLGFYGRSFTLADPSCYQPGCLFKSGGSPGPCTDNSGTLSYREIMDVIDRYNISPYYDEDAEAKYITWEGDQWVSYDDQETFQAKIKFANKLGLGGLLIWALDQDTSQLDALSGVIYPEKLGTIGAMAESANNWEDMGGGDCRVTECGFTGCNTGEVKMTDMKCDGDGSSQSICCPFAASPDPETCTWRGGAPQCNGRCHNGEVALASGKWGSGDHCDDGHKFYCCPAANKVPDCRWTDCGDSCDNDENELTWGDGNCWFGERQNFCCSKKQDWKNCDWHGKGGSCFDNHCPTGHSVALTTSYEGEGTTCGFRLERERSFCCDPADNESPFLPVPLDYLFENPPTGDDVDTDFTLKVDPTYGGAFESNPLADDPGDSQFGFVVLASPEEIQTTLDKRDGSHWDVFDCADTESEEAQTVRMVCTDQSEDGNCHKIHLGHGAPGTIVEMPRGCGPGKYAVVKEMAPSGDQQLPDHLTKRGLESSTVYDLTFDYDFSRVPRDSGETQMRIDVSNEPGYWDKVVDKAASKRKVKRELSEFGGNHRRWLEDAYREDKNFYGTGHSELHKRWFGEDVIAWLKGLLNGDSDSLDIPVLTNSYSDDFTVVILDETFPDCPIGPGGTLVNGKLHVSATTSVNLETSFGFTLVTTLQSLDFTNSYLYFRNAGDVSAKFKADAVAQAKWSSGDIKLLGLDTFGATFSVPGIVTIGPNFEIHGEVKGDLTLAAEFEASVNIASWDIRQTYPVANDDWDPKSNKSPDRDGTQELLSPQFDYGVSASGSIEAHVKPTISFGIKFNDKITDTQATVNLVADGHVTFHADASHGKSGGSSFCYGIDAGADLFATVEAPFPDWSLPKSPYALASTPAIAIVPETCPITSESRRDLRLPTNDTWNVMDDLALATNPSSHLARSLERRGQVYGPLFRIPKLSCPSSDGDGLEQTVASCLLCDSDEDDNEDTEAIEKRDDDDSGEVCLLIQGNPAESTCSSSVASKRDLGWASWVFGEAPINETEVAEHVSSAHSSHMHKHTKRTDKTGSWNAGSPTDVDMVNFGPYPSCSEASSDSSVIRWFGFEPLNQPKGTCPTTITKFNKNQIHPSNYQTDHIFEAQTILLFLDMLRGGTQFNGPRLPTGYTAATNQWVSGKLMGFNFNGAAGTQPFGVEGEPNLFIALSKDLGGKGAGTRLALLEKGTNRAKGAWLGLKDPGYISDDGLRATKVFQRDIAGVFQYMQDQRIWNKFTETSTLIEDSLINFDTNYNWGGNTPGELGRPNRNNAGLRDLWCYFIDTYLNTIETAAAGWRAAAPQQFSSQSFAAGREGQAWLDPNTGFFATHPPMVFPHPNPAAQPGQRNVQVRRSRFGAWDDSNGVAGPW